MSNPEEGLYDNVFVDSVSFPVRKKTLWVFTAGSPYVAGISYCTVTISQAADDKFI